MVTMSQGPDWKAPLSDFKWPIVVAHQIAAPAAELWDAISTPGNLEPCHPFCAFNPVYQWPGEASRDEVHYLSGRVLERRFFRWIEGVGYDLEIGEQGGRSSIVSWRIKPAADENAVLRIAIYPHLLQKVPVGVRWLPHFLRLAPMLKSYLWSAVKGFDWYLKYDEPVPRNQFGTHPWFSAPDPVNRTAR